MWKPIEPTEGWSSPGIFSAGSPSVPNRRARGGLDAIQEFYHRACAHADAVARVDAFNFEVPIAPMYDPPQLAMQKVLDETVADSAEGRAYLQKLDALQAECTAALDAARADRSASVAIEEMWADTIGNLEPIVFIKCPPFDVNAIAPYTSNGASPASICVYDPARPDQPARVIYEEPRGGAIFDMNLSYDAKTIFFAVKPDSAISGGWDVFEIGVDGRGLKRFTQHDPNLRTKSGSASGWKASFEGPGWSTDSNISPVELPSGDIMFVSSGTDIGSNNSGWIQIQQRLRFESLYWLDS